MKLETSRPSHAAPTSAPSSEPVHAPRSVAPHEFIRAIAASISEVPDTEMTRTWQQTQRQFESFLSACQRLDVTYQALAKARGTLGEIVPEKDLVVALRQMSRIIEDSGGTNQSRIIFARRPAPTLDSLKGTISHLRNSAPDMILPLEDAGTRFFRAYLEVVHGFADSAKKLPDPIVHNLAQHLSVLMGRVTPLVQVFNFSDRFFQGRAVLPGEPVPTPLLAVISRGAELEQSGGVALPALLVTALPGPGAAELPKLISSVISEAQATVNLISNLIKASGFLEHPVGAWMGGTLPNFRVLKQQLVAIGLSADVDVDTSGPHGEPNFSIGEYRTFAARVAAHAPYVRGELGVIPDMLDRAAQQMGLSQEALDRLPFRRTFLRLNTVTKSLEGHQTKSGRPAVDAFLEGNSELFTLDEDAYLAYGTRAEGAANELRGFPLGNDWSLLKTPERFRYSTLEATIAEARAIALKELGIEAQPGRLANRSYGELMRLHLVAKDIERACAIPISAFASTYGEQVLQNGREDYREKLRELAQVAEASPDGFFDLPQLSDLAPLHIEDARVALLTRQIRHVLSGYDLDWEPTELVGQITWQELERRLNFIPADLVVCTPELFELSSADFDAWVKELEVNDALQSELPAKICINGPEMARAYHPRSISRTSAGLQTRLARLQEVRRQQAASEDLELTKLWAEELGLTILPGQPVTPYSVIDGRLADLGRIFRAVGLDTHVAESLQRDIAKVAAALFLNPANDISTYFSQVEQCARLAKQYGWDALRNLLDNAQTLLAPAAISSTHQTLRTRN